MITRPLSHLLNVSLLLVSLLLPLSTNAADDDLLTMNMRDADIRALIQWVADNTGKNIVVHKDVQGKVTVHSAKQLSPAEAYQVFLSVLQVHGFAAIETANALKIVPKNIAQSSGAPIIAGADADMVVSAIKVNNVSVIKLAQAIKPLASREAVVAPYATTNTLIIADHASNIINIRKLIRKLDQAGDTDIEVIKLRHASADDILRSLNSLLPDNKAGDRSQQVNMSVDERSNSLLLAGDPAKRSQIRKLIAQLDEPLTGDGNTQVIYLHYVDAAELTPILNSLSKSIEKDQKNPNSNVSIEASESANALVINAPPAMLNTMKRVISQLDIRRAQVLVEALVVEVSGDVANDIGVSWVTTEADSINDQDGIVGVRTLGDLTLAEITTDDNNNIKYAGPSDGITFGYFENGNLQAAIRALKATQKANILSTPTIVAIDNEEASLLVGKNVPFKTGQSTGAASGTDNPFTTIERQDIGTSLVVTPRINQGDSITLDIHQKTEDIADSVATASDIITTKREIITKALIKDGQVLVLGGLIDDKERETQQKVPLLGDLPLIGKLFSSTGKTHEKTNLMVFIHPVILKDEEHVASVTQRRYNFMKNLQHRVKDKQWDASKSSKINLMDDFATFEPNTNETEENKADE